MNPWPFLLKRDPDSFDDPRACTQGREGAGWLGRRPRALRTSGQKSKVFKTSAEKIISTRQGKVLDVIEPPGSAASRQSTVEGRDLLADRDHSGVGSGRGI